MPDDNSADLRIGCETPVRGLEGRAGHRPRRLRRSGFGRIDVARGPLAPRIGPRPAARRRHRRSRPACRGRARGARGQAAGPQPRSALIAPCAGARAKPKTGLPAAARTARYRLLAQAAQAGGATHILTAHTRDDQAETLLMRMLRGSGIAGLAAMARQSEREGVVLARPFLNVSKSRLVATLQKAGIAFADDPTNRDTGFTRPRLRGDPAGSGGRGRRYAQPGATGVAAWPGQCGGGDHGRRRRALSGAQGSPCEAAGACRQLVRLQRVCCPAGGNPAAAAVACDQSIWARGAGRTGQGRGVARSSRPRNAGNRTPSEAPGTESGEAEANSCRRTGEPDRRPDPYRTIAAPPSPDGEKGMTARGLVRSP